MGRISFQRGECSSSKKCLMIVCLKDSMLLFLELGKGNEFHSLAPWIEKDVEQISVLCLGMSNLSFARVGGPLVLFKD